MKAFAVLMVLLVGAFAGCIQNGDDASPTGGAAPRKKIGAIDPQVYVDKLSKSIHTKILKENVKVASFDGKKMDNWVYRPDVPEGTKVPVFINFSPYWSNAAPASVNEGDAFSRYMIHEYVPRGYAIVLSSLRGTGFSEGCFNIGGTVEQKDAVAIIEHFAKQAWSSGSVAAGGKSYDGTTPQGAAIHAPEALKAIFPVSGISELYKYNYKGGIPFGNGFEFNARYFATMSTPQTYPAEPRLILEDASCTYAPEVAGHGVASGATGDYSAYWQERNYSKSAGKVKAAVFFVHGFTDWNVKPDHILPWLNAIPADVPRKVWLHNWTVGRSDGHVYPMRTDWNLTMLRFLDQTLKGIETGIFDEPTFQIQDSDGQFRWEETWPPMDAALVRLYLTKSALALSAGPNAPAVFSDDRTPPPPSGVNNLGSGGSSSICRQSASSNLLRYELTLDREFRYAGEPIVHLPVKTDTATGKVVVTLCALGPKGEFQMINWGGLNLRHRQSLENPQTVTPDTVYNLRFPLFPQDDVVGAGWKIVAYVGGYGGQYQAVPTGSKLTITEGANAWIEFPVDMTIAYESPQPEQMQCFAC